MESRYEAIHPFTCYFCNKLVKNETEYGHVSSCGSVLEPCSNKCGLYVTRDMKSRHLKECKNRKSKSMSRLSEDNNIRLREQIIINNPGTSSLGRPKSNLNHPELIRLSNNFRQLDQTCIQLSQSVHQLKCKHQDAVQSQKTIQMQIQMQLDKINYQNQVIAEWKRNVEMQMGNLKQESRAFQKFHNESEVRLASLKAGQGVAEKSAADLQLLRRQFQEEQIKIREGLNDLREKRDEFKDYFVQENAAVAALWNDHKDSIDGLFQEVARINLGANEQKIKQSSVSFEVKAAHQVSAETSERLEIQERLLGRLKGELAQFKIDFQHLEETLSTNCGDQTTGRLLWKVSDFGLKMDMAKENDTVIKSPVFYTHEYGYKIKLQIYLNGIKKWKGRHMIVCIHVLKGEYDLLHKWPCFIEGTFVLRDLYNHANPADFSKYILAKRQSGGEENEEPQESSTQYIFVPHTTLLKQNFIKEDTMIVDLRINSVNRPRDETEL